MKKLLMIILVLVFGINISDALEPVMVSIIKTDNANAVAVTVELNDYSSGSAVNVFPNMSMGSLSPNSSGVISFVVDGAAWQAIDVADVNTSYIVDVNVAGNLYAQYRLDELIAIQSTADIQSAKTYKVGDFAHGGIVAYVDASGKHGFVVSMDEISSGMRWWAGSNESITVSSGIYEGEQNTMNIIMAQGEGDGDNYAAKACHNYRYIQDGIIYRNWYLPEIYEWNRIGNNRTLINTSLVNNGGGAIPINSLHWLSYITGSTNAAYANLNGAGGNASRLSGYRVRAIRAF